MRVSVAAPTRELSLSDRSPIARSYRKFLGRAMITMFALIIVGAYLSPLLYMVTTSFQQPSQISTPGAPPWPAKPDTGALRGQGVPDLHRLDRRRRPEPHARRARAPVERLRRSVGSDRDEDRVAGTVADAVAVLAVLAAGRELHDGLAAAELPATALQHGRDRAAQHDRCRLLVDPRRVRVRPVSVPGTEPLLLHPARHDHPAEPGHAPPAVRDLHVARLERDVAAAHRSRTSSRTPSTSSCCASTS